MDAFIQGFHQIANLSTIIWMSIGSIVGIILGALPGLTATMGIALMMPIAFQLPTATGIGLLLAVYCGAVSGASIPAILIGIPGNPNAIATVEDGLLMTKKGKAGEALGGAVVASFIGGIGSSSSSSSSPRWWPPHLPSARRRRPPSPWSAWSSSHRSGQEHPQGLLMGAFGMALAFGDRSL